MIPGKEQQFNSYEPFISKYFKTSYCNNLWYNVRQSENKIKYV